VSDLRARQAALRVPYRKRFDRRAKRRRETECHAKYVGAADTDDLSRWLMAWIWHNPQAKDQIGAVIECARRMGRTGFTAADAEVVIEEASCIRRHLSADNLACFLGVTYEVRQKLGLTTIGSINVRKRARIELRKRRDRLAKERRRRERGARPQSQSLSRTRPWETLKMSRRQWYRNRKLQLGTTSSTADSISSDDKTVPPESSQGRSRPKEGFPLGSVSPTFGIELARASAHIASDEPISKVEKNLARFQEFDLGVFETLPVEVRMASLCLN
jgi:hypothetical protein